MSLVHQIKRIQFLNREVAVCLQNENGPCPLLALVNVLLLRGTLEMHKDRSEITSEQLIAMVGNLILEKNPLSGNEAVQATLQQTLDDVIQLLPTLQFGLDVNVRFTGIGDFEFDSRISVFDLLDVNLFHGWVIDPTDKQTRRVIGSDSYNQLMDRLIKSQEMSEGGAEGASSEALVAAVQDAEVINKFLGDTASQLTFAGLVQLHEKVRERQLCAFFRNNHFSAMFKIDGRLFLLVTDQGYRENNTVAWELLNEINGDTDMMSPSFGSPNEYIHPRDLGATLQDGGTSAADSKVDPDQLLALQIHQDEMNAARSRGPQPSLEEGKVASPKSPGSGCRCM